MDATQISVIGAPWVADALTAAGVAVRRVDGGAAIPEAVLGQLVQAYADDRIGEANARVCEHLQTTRPVVTGVVPAGLAIDMPPGRCVLVGGPPRDWADLPQPQRRAVAATCVLEGWASDPDEAVSRVGDGGITVATALPLGAAAPGAAAIGPSTPCWTLRDDATGAVAAVPVLHGAPEAVWRGVVTPASLRAERVLTETLAPGLAAALRMTGPRDVLGIAAEALGMGDDGNVRTRAAALLVLRDLLPALAARAPGAVHAAATLLPGEGTGAALIVGAARAALAGVPGDGASTVLTHVAGDRGQVALQIAGLPGRWFHAPSAPPVDGGGRAMCLAGDSGLADLLGLGAATGAPVDAGGTAPAPAERRERIATVALARSRRFATGPGDAGAVPLGVDVRACLDAQLEPVVNAWALPVAHDAEAIVRGVRVPLDAAAAALTALLYALEAPAPGG